MTTVSYLQHFQRRILQDAIAEGAAAYWLGRAEEFERCKPRPGEYHGRATRAELSARWRRCDDTAKACRNRATFAHMYPDDFDTDVDLVLGEAA